MALDPWKHWKPFITIPSEHLDQVWQANGMLKYVKIESSLERKLDQSSLAVSLESAALLWLSQPFPDVGQAQDR